MWAGTQVPHCHFLGLQREKRSWSPICPLPAPAEAAQELRLPVTPLEEVRQPCKTAVRAGRGWGLVPEPGSVSTVGRQYLSMQCWRMNSTRSSGWGRGCCNDTGIHTSGCACVFSCTPTEGRLAPSLQANPFAVWLDKEVLHTHVLCDDYV